MDAKKEVAIVAFTLCVLSGRARAHHRDTVRALATGETGTEVFGRGKFSWGIKISVSLEILSQISVAKMRCSGILNLPASSTDDRVNDKAGRTHSTLAE